MAFGLVMGLWIGLLAGAAAPAHADPGGAAGNRHTGQDVHRGDHGTTRKNDRKDRRTDNARAAQKRRNAPGAPGAAEARAQASETATRPRDTPRRAPRTRSSSDPVSSEPAADPDPRRAPRTRPTVTPRKTTTKARIAAARIAAVENPAEQGRREPESPAAQADAVVENIRGRARTLVPEGAGPESEASIPTLSAAHKTTIVNVVGSVVFNVIGAALQVFSGPAVAPPGSTVTVRTSTLTMPDTGQTVRADWYFPENSDSSTRLIYLQHGFMATGPMYSYTASYLAEHTNSIVVAPTLSSNLFDPDAQWIGGEPMQQSVADLFVDDRPQLTASASAAAGHQVTLPSDFVLVGHSLGGMLVTGAAGRMVDNGAVDHLAGVVLLDAVDTNQYVPAALAKLSGANYRPVLNISSERYVWNLDGTVGDELQDSRPAAFNGVVLVGGRHIDAAQGGNPILQFAEYVIAGFSQPQNSEAAKVISAGWINDMFAGTHDGIYGAPQQSVTVPTSAGTATAVVLPFTSTDSVQATPWDGVARVILNALFPFAVYQPLAVPSTVEV